MNQKHEPSQATPAAPGGVEVCANCGDSPFLCVCQNYKATKGAPAQPPPSSEGLGMRVVTYMANCMAMPDVETDQEQNWIAGHLHAFAVQELAAASQRETELMRARVVIGRWMRQCETAEATVSEQARQIEALTQERDEARSLNQFFRDSVGECHVMISRKTSAYQIRREWDSSDLPPRIQRVMQKKEKAEQQLSTVRAAFQGLHNQIVNIKATFPQAISDQANQYRAFERAAFLDGHKQARHAAAEMIAEALAAVPEDPS
jgi:hypothetical protein